MPAHLDSKDTTNRFPAVLPHPGTRPYKAHKGKSLIAYIGKDQFGAYRSVPLNRSLSCYGPAGSGKTVFLRSLLVGAVMQGMAVYACDPKMQLRPFRDFPGVGALASSVEESTRLIGEISTLMADRYEAVQHHLAAGREQPPVLFIVDELHLPERRNEPTPAPNIARAVATLKANPRGLSTEDFYNAAGIQGHHGARDLYIYARQQGYGLATDGKWYFWTGNVEVNEAQTQDRDTAAVERYIHESRFGMHDGDGTKLQAIQEFGPHVGIHTISGFQRPDFDKGRDLAFKCSIGPLSPQAALMIWGDQHIGTNLPRHRGHAMATVAPLDGHQRPTTGLGPVEVKTFWISEPGKATGRDKRVLRRIAKRARRKFAGYQFPI